MSEYSISESILPPSPQGELAGQLVLAPSHGGANAPANRLRDTAAYLETERGEWVPLTFPKLAAPMGRWLVNMRGASVVFPGQPTANGKFEVDLIFPFYLRGRPRASLFNGRLETIVFDGGTWISATFEEALQGATRSLCPVWMQVWWRMTGYSIHVMRIGSSLAALRE